MGHYRTPQGPLDYAIVLVIRSIATGFGLSSLETTHPESPRDNNTWQSLGLILSMVTVGADMVDPMQVLLKKWSQNPTVPGNSDTQCIFCIVCNLRLHLMAYTLVY